MIGKQARVVERLAPHGYVEIHGELWKGITEQKKSPIEKNARVRVLDVQGLTLLVAPEVDMAPVWNRERNGRADEANSP
jgi:membrane-bound ClpP family serine protease